MYILSKAHKIKQWWYFCMFQIIEIVDNEDNKNKKDKKDGINTKIKCKENVLIQIIIIIVYFKPDNN